MENYVVGAPCGVMDQMASACGEANKLLAMICQVLFLLSSFPSKSWSNNRVIIYSLQPAEILGLVEIPSHIRFWGIDSGIRHRYCVVYYSVESKRFVLNTNSFHSAVLVVQTMVQ